MAHEHNVHDSDKHFSIDPVTRVITNESGKFVLIQHDHNSEQFTFSIPKEVDGHDMSRCNRVKIHYLNVELAEDLTENGEVKKDQDGNVILVATGTVYKGIDEATDIKVSEEDESKVVCSWLISRNATQYAGELNFSIRYSCIDDNGKEVYGWGTEDFVGITVGDGIFNNDVIVEEYADILEKWRQELVLANVVKQYTPEQARSELGAAAMKKTTVTLSVGGWSSNQQTVSADVVTADNVVIPSPVPANHAIYGECGIVCISQAAKTLTFQCTEVPAQEIKVNVVTLE